MLNKKQVDKTNILFRVEATPALGMGHFVRCLSLAEKLKDSTSDIDLTFVTSSNAIGDRIKSCDYGLIGLPLSVNMIKEVKYYKKYLKKAVCVTDVPNIPEEYIKVLKENNCAVISIDDGSETMFYSDILINPNLKPFAHHAHSSRTQYYNGAKYIILKEAFEKFTGKKKRIKEKAESLFVCFGGGDKGNITHRIVNNIIKTGLNAIVVIGMFYPYRDELIKSVDGYKNIEIVTNANNMDELIDKADLAIISGGTLLHETCAVGTPAIVICQNQDQNTESGFFAQNHAAINLGVFDQINEEVVCDTIHDLIIDHNMRKLLSENAKRLIDVKGTDRIARIILTEFFKK